MLLTALPIAPILRSMEGRTMQKWEYLYLQAEVPFVRQAETYVMNGVKCRYEADETFYGLLARLGQDGWELACMPGTGAFYFKRPLKET